MTTIPKPSTPSYTEIEKPGFLCFLLKQDGGRLLLQSGGRIILAEEADFMTEIAKPSIPIYTTITKPS